MRLFFISVSLCSVVGELFNYREPLSNYIFIRYFGVINVKNFLKRARKL